MNEGLKKNNEQNDVRNRVTWPKEAWQTAMASL